MVSVSFLNPGGSVKDRPALQIVKDALDKKLISKGQQLLKEPLGIPELVYVWLGMPFVEI